MPEGKSMAKRKLRCSAQPGTLARRLPSLRCTIFPEAISAEFQQFGHCEFHVYGKAGNKNNKIRINLMCLKMVGNMGGEIDAHSNGHQNCTKTDLKRRMKMMKKLEVNGPDPNSNATNSNSQSRQWKWNQWPRRRWPQRGDFG